MPLLACPAVLCLTARNLAWVACVFTLLSLAGCASSRPGLAKTSPPGDIAPPQAQRHQVALAVFEHHRDQAQLQAALDRWQQNDLGGCETRLRTLVARRPDFIEARLRLAELAWSCADPAEAEAQYRAALALAPDRADIHHALGLVLESLGRTDEARAALFAPASSRPTTSYSAPRRSKLALTE